MTANLTVFHFNLLGRNFRYFIALSFLSLLFSVGLLAKVAQAKPSQAETKLSKSVNKKILIKPKIQLAILLDTSSSMDGLIDQTRNQLWQVVNEFSTATQNGVTPILEVALFEYGNSGIPKSEGHIRQLNQFTRELDKVSEGLFQLTTNGGDEYCGMAIETAVKSLQWSQKSSDLKTIFIAGNEAFSQGPVAYQEAIALARKQGITVNTIFAGGHQHGVQAGWYNGAKIAGGEFMSIDANQAIAHIDAPQDKLIASFNQSLNQTYLPYGQEGREKAKRQVMQDQESSKISGALLASRAKSKASSYYNNSQWDLVDAFNDGEISEESLAKMEVKSLPKPMQKLDASQRKEFILAKAAERTQIKKKIAELSKERELFVNQKRKSQSKSEASVSDALTSAVIKQAEAKSFDFSKEALEMEVNKK